MNENENYNGNQADTKDLPEPAYNEGEVEEEYEGDQLRERFDTERQLESVTDYLVAEQELSSEKSACRGCKRKRWTMEEESDLMKEFKVHIIEKRNPSTKEIKFAIDKYHSLKERSETVIRSKINNIILVKAKCNVEQLSLTVDFKEI